MVEVVISDRKIGVRESKPGIQLDSFLKRGHRVHCALIAYEPASFRESSQGVQRTSSGALERQIEFLQGGRIFAEFSAKLSGGQPERMQSLTLVCSVALHACDRVAGSALRRVQLQTVPASVFGDTSSQVDCGAEALAQLRGKIPRDACVDRAAQGAKRFTNFFNRDEVQ